MEKIICKEENYLDLFTEKRDAVMHDLKEVEKKYKLDVPISKYFKYLTGYTRGIVGALSEKVTVKILDFPDMPNGLSEDISLTFHKHFEIVEVEAFLQ